MDVNKVIMIGRLTHDAELTYTTGGAAIMNFSIAVDHKKNKDGSANTSYFQCKAFGKIGENLKPYLIKGKQVAITGYNKQERWEKDGQKQSRVIINCDEIQLLGGGSGNQNNTGYQQDYGYGA